MADNKLMETIYMITTSSQLQAVLLKLIISFFLVHFVVCKLN